MLKTYKVSFTVQSEEDWEETDDDKQLHTVLPHDWTIWVPKGAEIELIAPPLQDGYYLLSSTSEVYKRNTIDGITRWFVKAAKNWITSWVMTFDDEKNLSHELTWIGPIVEEKRPHMKETNCEVAR